MSIYKDCDIRGVYGSELTAAEVYRIGRALATLCSGRILVGGDVRLSTPELKKALMDGLLASGANVVDLGTIPTPALYFALKHTPAQAGATVTASHNPPQYNGVKFMIGDTPVTRDTIERLKQIVADGAFREAAGTLEVWDAAGEYLAAMKARFHAPKALHVLVDAGCGAMSRIAPEAFRAAGYRVIELSCHPDGSFPDRSPNPADFTCLGNTSKAVRESGADFGVAFDGDGDRAVFLDERGEPVQNEKALALFVGALLKDKPTPVVYDQKSSSIVRDTILRMGGTPMPERSGHAFIKKRFLDNGAAVAGEVSGHFFFGELGYDDGLFAALFMAQLIVQGGRTLGEMAGEIVCPPITPDIRVFCPYAEQQSWLDRVEAAARAQGAVISHLDGVRADFPDCWFLIRKSVTAQQITLRAEARTQARLDALLAEIAQQLPEAARAALRE